MAWVFSLNPETVERAAKGLMKGITTMRTVYIIFENKGPSTVWTECQKKVDYGSDAMHEVPPGQTERWSRQWNMSFDFAVYSDPSGAPSCRLAHPLVKTNGDVTLTWDGRQLH